MARSISRNALTMAWATVLSRILGFMRDMVLAFVLGAGPLADAFFVAFRLPNILRRLFAEGSLTMAFVPVFSRILETKGPQEGFLLTRSIQVWLLILLGMCTLVVWLLADTIALLLAPGFAGDSVLLDQTAYLLRICFPYILFISSVALCMGTLNGMGHFLSPALAPCILNLALIVSAGSAYVFNRNVAVFLSWGVLAGGLGQWFLQQPALRGLGFRWVGGIDLLGAGVRKVGILLVPTIFGAGIYQINIVANTILASMLEKGSISMLYYADRIVQLPLGVFGVSLAVASLPAVSSLLAKKDVSGAAKAVRETFGLTWFIAVPSSVGLMIIAEPIVDLLFGRGKFGLQEVIVTSWALQAYAAGLPAFCGVRTLVSAFYSLEDTKTPVIAGTVSVAGNIILGIVLMRIWGLVGLALATSLASWINLFILALRLKTRLPWGLGLWPSLGRTLALSTFLGLLVWFTHGWGPWAVFLIPVWGILYGLGSVVLAMPEGRMLLEFFKKKKAK